MLTALKELYNDTLGQWKRWPDDYKVYFMALIAFFIGWHSWWTLIAVACIWILQIEQDDMSPHKRF